MLPPNSKEFDTWLDAQLRDVPVPAGLGQRTRQALLEDDEILDAALREVPIPAGFEDRLRTAALGRNEELDAALRTMPLPSGLLDRLRRIARKDRLRWPRTAIWAAAASVLIVVGLAGLMQVFVLLYLTASPQPEEMASSGAAPKSESQLAHDLLPEIGRDPLISAPVPLPKEENPPQRSIAAVTAPKIELDRFERPKTSPLDEAMELFGPTRNPLQDAAPSQWGVLSIHKEFDLPELKKAAGLIPRGIDPPLERGFDWAFFGRFRVHPFVWPGLNPRLQTSVVPLGVDTASFELTRRCLEDKELPPAGAVRTEEFLAAIDYSWPAPHGQPLGLSVAGGPSPFVWEGFHLFQIGVQAADSPTVQRPPVRLVLAIDVSASMRWGGRLDMVRGALEKLIGRLEPEDRLSIVAFSEDAQLLLEEAAGRDVAQIREAIKSLEAKGSTNLGAGLRLAYATAEQQASSHEAGVDVVLLTDGLTELDPDGARQIQTRLKEAAARHVRLHVIDMAQEEGKGLDPQLAEFAEAGCGRIHRASTASEVRWALLELVTGKSQVTAADVQLKVTFDPKTVLAYRLMGHEAPAMAGLLPAHPAADFHAGQSATALYEIRFRPDAAQDVATVELTWRETGPQSREHRLVQKIQRSQFAASITQAPLSLQAGALAAETAEILRDSPFVQNRRSAGSVSRVLEMASLLDSRLRMQPSMVDFLAVVQRAASARPHRTRGGR